MRASATASQRLAATPADMHVTDRTTWRWTECVMETIDLPAIVSERVYSIARCIESKRGRRNVNVN